MRRYLSLSYKVLFTLLVTAVFVSAIIVTTLLYQGAYQEQKMNQSLLSANVTRYLQLSSLLNERFSVWVESLIHISDEGRISESELVEILQRANDFLLLQWDVGGLWLLGPSEELIYTQTGPVRQESLPLVKLSLVETRPMSDVYCNAVCEQLVSIPIKLNSNERHVIVLSTSFVEIMALLNEALNAEIATVSRGRDIAQKGESYQISSPMAEGKQVFMSGVINALQSLPEEVNLITDGAEITVNRNAYLVSLLPLYSNASHSNYGNYLLFVHDINDRKLAYKAQNRTIFLGAVALLVAFILSIFVMLKRYAYKLKILSRLLPLLAHKRFDEFKRQQTLIFSRRYKFRDELDLLGEATEALAGQLEVMDQQMTVNTAKLEKMAMFDSLTGLPNRNMMTFHINKQLALMQRQKTGLALFFIDLDNFKKVNDSHGHHFGDEVVKVASERLSLVVRETDLVSRFGGDEFVILVSNVVEEEQARVVASKLIEEFVTPIIIGDHTFYIGISIGIAFIKGVKSSAMELMRHADTAMYEAKLDRGSSFRFFNPTMNQKVLRQVELESEAQIAIKEQQFFLALQPQIDVVSYRLTGFEALIRWQHPIRGTIYPDEFLPLIEHSPIMEELDFWVIEHAIGLLAELKDNGYSNVKMAINVSASQFANEALQPYLEACINKYKVDPLLIELELTETVLLADIDRAVSIIQQIRSLGCQIAVDDFGTGYSSLSYLKIIPSDLIKIDRSFISGMLETETDHNIVSSTITMVRNMGLHVVAEGIEQPEQLRMLASMNCQFGQGYYISKPIFEDQLWEVLTEKVANGCWLLPSAK